MCDGQNGNGAGFYSEHFGFSLQVIGLSYSSGAGTSGPFETTISWYVYHPIPTAEQEANNSFSFSV
jgi:hypothetical protein